jgi:urease accessory protein
MLADHASAAAGDVFAWRSAGATMQRAHGVGRLGFALRDGRTAVMTCYQEAGLRIRMPRVEPGAPLEAVVINTAGGITGGDRFTLDIDAGEGTRAVVTSQAAEKVYRSSGAVGTFSTAIRVGQGASMAWLPQEAILFDGSALDRSLDITMAADSTVLAVESVVFGRLARGESVATGRLFDRWRIRRGGRLVYAEGLRFDGAVAARLDAKACAAGAIAQRASFWWLPMRSSGSIPCANGPRLSASVAWRRGSAASTACCRCGCLPATPLPCVPDLWTYWSTCTAPCRACGPAEEGR